MEYLDRPLRIMGDWGTANFHRVCGLITNGLFNRLGPSTQSIIFTGRAYRDNVEAVSSGAVDVALTTPPLSAKMGFDGIGIFDRAHPTLRALAALPHEDAMLMAVPAESTIRSFEDILTQKFPLRLATAPNDGVCLVGFAAQAILNEYGLTRETIESFGGHYYERERPGLA